MTEAISYNLETIGVTDSHLDVVEAMAAQAGEIAASATSSRRPPEHVQTNSSGVLVERAIVYDPEALQGSDEVVVFLGKRRENVPPEVEKSVDLIDKRLRGILAQGDAVSSYSTWMLRDAEGNYDLQGNHANLVVPKGGIEAFGKHPAHRTAAEVLAPAMYSQAIILKGRFPGGVTSGSSFEITAEPMVHPFPAKRQTGARLAR